MRLPQFFREPVQVEERIRVVDGMELALPVAFTWRGRRRPVVDWGRQWQEASEAATWHCYLIHGPGGETFDLRRSAEDGRWILARAWLDDRA